MKIKTMAVVSILLLSFCCSAGFAATKTYAPVTSPKFEQDMQAAIKKMFNKIDLLQTELQKLKELASEAQNIVDQNKSRRDLEQKVN